MEALTSIRALIFLHMVIIALVTRTWFLKTPDKEDRTSLLKGSVIFWFISLFCVVLVMILTATVMAIAFTRQENVPRTWVIWAIEVGMGAIAAGLSGYILDRRLKSARS